jgi:ferredoxin-NADP reductase
VQQLQAAPRTGWHVAEVVETRRETPSAARITLDVDGWPGNLAGQHLDVRLTAPDGYQAQRSYSIASAGPGTRVELAVDELPDGEVSPFLVHDLMPGDQLEVHGPLGGYFVWRPGTETERPVQLIAGGSGVVPLLAMARAHADAGDTTPFGLLYSVRSPADVFYRQELAQAAASSPLDLRYVYTRVAPPGAATPPGRLTRDALAAAVPPSDRRPRIFVCGPTPFVEQVAVWLQELGHAPGDIRTERFGGS